MIRGQLIYTRRSGVKPGHHGWPHGRTTLIINSSCPRNFSDGCGHARPDVSVSRLKDMSATGKIEATYQETAACDAQPGLPGSQDMQLHGWATYADGTDARSLPRAYDLRPGGEQIKVVPTSPYVQQPWNTRTVMAVATVSNGEMCHS